MKTVANCLHSSEDQGICPKCGQELCRRRSQEEARFTRVRPTDDRVVIGVLAACVIMIVSIAALFGVAYVALLILEAMEVI